MIALLALALVAGAAVGTYFNRAADRTAPPSPANTREPAAATATAAPERGRERDWSLIADTRQDAGGDTGRQSELLEQRLRTLAPQAIDDFQRFRHTLDERLYTWELWGAAYVIEDGCSDDCFRDFRAYVISLGPKAYEAALRDPDSLAGVAQDAETGDWENADDVAPDAYQAVTGEDIPAGDSEPSGPPRGEPWDDDQAEQLAQRYPRLAARFR